MKKTGVIILSATLAFAAVSGCSRTESVEIYRSAQNTEYDTKTARFDADNNTVLLLPKIRPGHVHAQGPEETRFEKALLLDYTQQRLCEGAIEITKEETVVLDAVCRAFDDDAVKKDAAMARVIAKNKKGLIDRGAHLR